jgi:rod shape-determining protein MreC
MQFSNQRKTKLIFLAVAVLLLLFFLHFIKVLRPVENLVVTLTKAGLQPTYKLSNWIGENYLDFKSKRDLIRENKDLKDQIATLLKEKSEFLTEQEENDFLRKQLNFTKDFGYDFEVANVIGKAVDKVQNTIILDRGLKSGVVEGQPVVTDKGILIGKILKVTKNSAIVLLINDDLSKVAAKIQNKAKTIGVVEGEYGLGIKMRLVPQTEMIKEGDVVVTSGLEKSVPAGILIGQVERVMNAPEELFQEASIKSAVEFNKVTMVTVIKEKNAD